MSGSHFAGVILLEGAEATFERVIKQYQALSINETINIRIDIHPCATL